MMMKFVLPVAMPAKVVNRQHRVILVSLASHVIRVAKKRLMY